MKGKTAKKLRRLAKVFGGNKTPQEQDVIYKRLKKIHKTNKGEI